MIKNYLKTAWRNIRKNRLFSFINIFGLSIGIATAFIIMLYVQGECNFDRFNKNADNIATIIFQADINVGKINESVLMPPVAATIKKDSPEITEATRLMNFGSPKIKYNDKVCTNS